MPLTRGTASITLALVERHTGEKGLADRDPDSLSWAQVLIGVNDSLMDWLAPKADPTEITNPEVFDEAQAYHAASKILLQAAAGGGSDRDRENGLLYDGRVRPLREEKWAAAQLDTDDDGDADQWVGSGQPQGWNAAPVESRIQDTPPSTSAVWNPTWT